MGRQVSRSIDLHGQRLEDAVQSLEGLLASAPRGSWVRVIHGHGTGTLAAACERLLRNDSRVAEIERPHGERRQRAELLVRMR